MTLLHRAGLGGLAATLRAMERRHKLGRLSKDQLPGGPDLGNGYPWRIEPTSITLDWGEPTAARDYLQRLFAFAFGIKDKLIDLPGTYRDELSRAVRAELQLGLTLTFLQHGNTRTLSDPSLRFFDPTGAGLAQVAVEWRPCDSYKHQKEAEDLTTKKGTLKETAMKIEGPLYPGAAVRHDRFPTRTKMEDLPDHAVALYFAPVGCLSLPVNRSVGVLLVPEVTDLAEFARVRPRMTPTTARDCRVGGPGDAALQAMVRLRGKRLMRRHLGGGIRRVFATRLAPQAWDKKQKYRDAALYVLPLGTDLAEEKRLRQFELALSYLPRRVSTYELDREHGIGRGKDAKGKQKTVKVKTKEQTWYQSLVRPVVADNLASGRRWYDGFARLLADRKTRRTVTTNERKGLQAMGDEKELLDEGETKFIYALHRAIYMARGKIFADTMGKDAARRKARANQATRNRWDRLMERLRLDLVGAKTQSQTQAAISETLARTGTVKELRDDEALREVKRMVFSKDWQRARNLALFAVASYKRPPDVEALPGDIEDVTETQDSEAVSEE